MKLIKIMFPVIVVTLIADQLTKVYAMEMLSEESIPVIPNFFSLSLAFNRGAAFGFLSGLPDGLRQFTLGVAALFALSAVLYILVRYHRESIIGCISVGLVIGGALGNIVDRVRLGAVVDFLDVYWGDMHWPTFNVADSCVCVGVAVLIFLKTDPAIDEQPVTAA